MSTTALTAGDTFTKTVRVKDTATNLPVSLIGYDFYFTLKQFKDDTDEKALLKKDVHIESETTVGEMVFFFTHEDTKDLTPCNAYLEVKFKDVAGNVYTAEQSRKQIKDSWRDTLPTE